MRQNSECKTNIAKGFIAAGRAASLKLILRCKRSTTLHLFLFFSAFGLFIFLFLLPNTQENGAVVDTDHNKTINHGVKIIPGPVSLHADF